MAGAGPRDQADDEILQGYCSIIIPIGAGQENWKSQYNVRVFSNPKALLFIDDTIPWAHLIAALPSEECIDQCAVGSEYVWL